MLHHLKTMIAAVVMMATAANAQTTIDVPLDQAAGLATRALLAGDTALALQIAQAVLRQKPDDRTALVVVAAAAPQLGDPDAGFDAAARAWRVSEGDVQKYEAARLAALAAANAEHYTLATIWLRVALTAAPNDNERTRTLRDARAVTRLNPWSTQLSFSLVPSSNVNGGAEDEESTAPGNPDGTLSVDALALAGWRASLSYGLQYRFQQSERSRSTVGIRYQGARVRLTEDTEIPDEAFTSDFIETTLRHVRVLGRGTIGAQVSTGMLTFRDFDLGDGTIEDDGYDVTRFRIDSTIPLSENVRLSLATGRDFLTYQSISIGEVDRTTINAGLFYKLANNDRVGLSLGLTDSDGDSVNFTSFQQSVGASYSWAEPIGPISLSVGASYSWIDYPNYRLLQAVTGGRQDETLAINMNVGFPDVSYAGFSPGLRISGSVSESNVSRFDRSSLSAGFTLNSSF